MILQNLTWGFQARLGFLHVYFAQLKTKFKTWFQNQFLKPVQNQFLVSKPGFAQLKTSFGFQNQVLKPVRNQALALQVAANNAFRWPNDLISYILPISKPVFSQLKTSFQNWKPLSNGLETTQNQFLLS